MKLRLFLTFWVVFTLHFATNVVREHYPAFALIDQGNFQLDDYAGFHADIFEHTDGHHYIGNQVTTSVLVALPLLVFDPALDALEAYRLRQISEGTLPAGGYDTAGPNRKVFYQKVKERGIDLRLGAATFVTTAFFNAPIAALLALLMFVILRRRGVAEVRAAWITVVFALGTPIFYRSVSLSHNLVLALAGFAAFALLWPGLHGERKPSAARRAWAGFLAGLCIAIDYAGVITLLCLFGYLLWLYWPSGGVRRASRAALAFVLGSVPPVAFLLYSQWAMFGNAFLPGQLWMPKQNIYVDVGARGFTAPDLDLLLANLIDLDWGLFAFSPLLLLAVVPALYRSNKMILPRPERWLAVAISLVLLVFCSCNQYARLQWNTGFRYLLPLVPFAFLLASEHLRRMRPLLFAAVAVPAILHTWVLTMVWYLPPTRGQPQAVPESWRLFLQDGVQLPWLSVIQRTSSINVPLLASPWLPVGLLLLAGLVLSIVWGVPGRLRARLTG